ncbi:MAG: primosomal protein N' [Phycisphaerales bacterium]|nr:primosomal protein N' [Phycisphaerales bacterium]
MPDLFGDETPAGYVQVAVERGIDRYPDGLTYALPPDMGSVAAGQRVLVPLGRGDRPTPGYIIETLVQPDLDPSRIKFVARRDDAEPALPEGLVALARWIASYYVAPVGMTLAAMLPAPVKHGIGRVVQTLIDLAPAGAAAPGRRSKQQRRVVEVLTALAPADRPVEIRDLAARAELRTTGSIKRLVEQGVLVATTRSTIQSAWASRAVDMFVPERLTPEQQQVFDAIAPTLDDGFAVHLLYGVTGSGKTEVYVRLIERVLAAGKVALVLVPEISLTPQTGGRLVARFPDRRVAILHSGLSAAQRHRQWAAVASGEAEIILGARSAVFAPVADGRIGLIIVDEEHDGSYKQDQVPRYHGRDVAIRRAQLEACPVLLGSATPAMESWHHATETGRYRLHTMEQRVPGTALPRVMLVDFAEQMKQYRDRRVHLIGPTLRGALIRTLDEGGQALLLLNRRGYANYIACADHGCGWLMTCDDCDTTMVYHVNRRLPDGGYVRCHHCGTENRLPKSCPMCGTRIVTFGLGTQRVEEELARIDTRLREGGSMMRVDSDTMHGARDYHAVLDRFAREELKVLVGTQMIAKGLDFPNVRLVGVINADTAINLPDFRAAERTFQLVSQVAGRCGRGSSGGLAIVQSFATQTPAIALAAAHDYRSFAASELEARARYRLPPHARMARILVRDADLPTCVSIAHGVRDRLDGLRSTLGLDAGPGAVRLRGPMPCPIARIAARHRQQVEVLAPGPGPLQRLLAAARAAGWLTPGESIAVDVDPMSLL